MSLANPKLVDTTGREINLGDLVMVFGEGTHLIDPTIEKKWSLEQVVMDVESCEKSFVFPKFMNTKIINIHNIKPEWLVVIKQNENCLIVEDNRFGFKDINKGFYNFK